MPPLRSEGSPASLTREKYEEVVSRLTGGKRRFESASDLPFDGLVVHATAETEHGFLVSMYSSRKRRSSGLTTRSRRPRGRSESRNRRTSIRLTRSFSDDCRT